MGIGGVGGGRVGAGVGGSTGETGGTLGSGRGFEADSGVLPLSILGIAGGARLGFSGRAVSCFKVRAVIGFSLASFTGIGVGEAAIFFLSSRIGVSMGKEVIGASVGLGVALTIGS